MMAELRARLHGLLYGPNRNMHIALVAGAALLIWLLSGLGGDSGDPDATQDVAEAEAPRLVETMLLRAVDFVPHLRLNARTGALRVVELVARTPGTLIGADVAEGTAVAEGTVLGQLQREDRPLRLQEAEARARQADLEHRSAVRLHARELMSAVQLAKAAAAAAAAQADLLARRLDLQHTSFVAPFDGRFNRRYFDVGDRIEVGQVYGVMLDLSQMRVVAEVPDHERVLIEPGSPAALVLQDGSRHEGRIHYASASASREGRTFRIEARVDNSGHHLLADISGVLEVAVAPVRAHHLPASVLTLDFAGSLYVKSVDARQQVQSHRVEVLADNADGVWVSGLPDEVRLISTGHEYVSVGETVSTEERARTHSAEVAQ